MNKENQPKHLEQKPRENQPKHLEKKPKRRVKLTRNQIILLVVAILLAIVLVIVLAYRALVVRPELPGEKPANPSSSAPGEQEPEPIDWGDGVRPRADGERKSKDFYTVLILGRDTGGGGQTDTMLLASYDVTNQKATVMSIPRDTMVNVPWDIKRINSVYNHYGGEERGIQHLYKEISQLVGFEPDYQVVVEWDAVGEIVDAMEGVYFDVPRDMNYDDPFQDLHIHQTAGYRLLTGDDAMQVLRYRHDNRRNGIMLGYEDGDIGRIRTQQAFLKAMVSQLLQVKNMTKIGAFIDVFKNNVETDLSFQNILWFAQSAVFGGLKMEDVNFVTMPNTTRYVYSRSMTRQTGKYNEQSYVIPNAKQLLELVNNELSPFKEVFTLSDLDIMSVNADGSLRSSTGHVEDTPAASPPPSREPEGEGDDPEVDENGNPIPPEGGEGTEEPGGEPGQTAPGDEPGITPPDEPGGDTPSVPGGEPGQAGPGGGTPDDPGGTEPGGDTPSEPGGTDPGGEPVIDLPIGEEDPGFYFKDPEEQPANDPSEDLWKPSSADLLID